MSPNKSSFSGNVSNQSQFEKAPQVGKSDTLCESQVCRTILISGGSENSPGQLLLQAETIFSCFVSNHSVSPVDKPGNEMKRTNVLIFVQYWTLLSLWKSAIIMGNLEHHERSSLLFLFLFLSATPSHCPLLELHLQIEAGKGLPSN